MSADRKPGTKVAAKKPVEGKKKAVKRTAPAAKAKKPARKKPPLLAPAKPKKAKVAASPAAKKPVTVAPAPAAPRKSFFSFLGFGNASRARAGKTKMTDLIKK
jgi:hypothetical protein